ncbi:DJ-1 [Tilletiaria anomala UBC 951]|uniref:D-lactate dehydratase n=1 Tax=Tilletiaria anomala (strain ATCC 24038 / CBS 436.72 / UBC 951) TaxID=1037660 RepID=A0A066V6B8_TILAU|nr:DJ-1 [Tilletiaria anomala UBC 951]KDN37016.1 DJ-1 [Tilletiaria anomala UBC 951]
MSKKALIFIAEGTEESEYTITYDVLVRGGVTVQSVWVGTSNNNTELDPHGTSYVTCSRGVKIVPDLRLLDLEGGAALEYDALIVPGGLKGAETISGNENVSKLLAAAYGQGKLVACICAGSLAAKAAGIKDKPITSHPSVKDHFKDFNYSEDRVVVTDGLITSRGPGTAFEFALALVEALAGKEKRAEITPPMLLPPAIA